MGSILKGVIFLEFTELKEDFYKRYNGEKNFLHYTSCGALCTFLGHNNLPNTPFISCGLSMRAEVLARKSDDGIIKLESTESNKCMQHRIGVMADLYKGKPRMFARLLNSAEKVGINGAEVLYKSTIPGFISSKEAFSTALVKALTVASGKEFDVFKIAEICALNNNPIPYAVVLSARKGYCVYADKDGVNTIPFPMYGYKILIIHCDEKIVNYTDEFNEAMRMIHRYYPHVRSIADVEVKMLSNSLGTQKHKTHLNLMYHLLSENNRIIEAKKALTHCDIKTFFRKVNNSQMSFERFLHLGDEYRFLLQTLRNLGGVTATRCNNNGVCVIVEDEFVDNVVSIVKNKFERTMGYSPSFCISDAM